MEKNVNTYGDLFFDVAETFIKVGEPAKAALVSSVINLVDLPTTTDLRIGAHLSCASLPLGVREAGQEFGLQHSQHLADASRELQEFGELD